MRHPFRSLFSYTNAAYSPPVT